MAASFWDKEVPFKEIPKGEKELYKFSLCTNGDRSYVSFREWYLEKTTGEFRPGKNGAVIPLELAEDVGNAILEVARSTS